MKREELKPKIVHQNELWSIKTWSVSNAGLSPLEQGIIEGENPVFAPESVCVRCAFEESSCLGLQLKMGGKFLLKLNNGKRPIANKYREGKMKSTLKRELNST